jgi:HEAT repeat protein
VPGLAGVLADPDAGVRAVAVRALAQLYPRCPDRAQTCLPAMATLLRDPDGLVRQAAADALALCGEDAVPLLAEILAQGSAPERSRAAYALRKMACLPAAVVLYRYLDDENLLVRTHAYEGLDDLGYLENTLLLP